MRRLLLRTETWEIGGDGSYLGLVAWMACVRLLIAVDAMWGKVFMWGNGIFWCGFRVSSAGWVNGTAVFSCVSILLAIQAATDFFVGVDCGDVVTLNRILPFSHATSLVLVSFKHKRSKYEIVCLSQIQPLRQARLWTDYSSFAKYLRTMSVLRIPDLVGLFACWSVTWSLTLLSRSRSLSAKAIFITLASSLRLELIGSSEFRSSSSDSRWETTFWKAILTSARTLWTADLTVGNQWNQNIDLLGSWMTKTGERCEIYLF